MAWFIVSVDLRRKAELANYKLIRGLTNKFFN